MEPPNARASRTPLAVLEGAVVFCLASAVALRGPNPLVVYADDLGITRAFSGLCLLTPALCLTIALLARSPRRRTLFVVAVCAALSAQSAGCLVEAEMRRAAGLLPSQRHLVDDPLQWLHHVRDERARWESAGSWIADVSHGLPAGVTLWHAHRDGGGSGSNQLEVLVSLDVRGASPRAIDWVDYAHSGNHPTSSETDWIVPLTTTPFARRQFWLRRAQHEPTSRLVEVLDDGRFADVSPWAALLPLCTALVPILAVAALRRRTWAAGALGVTLFAWLLAFAPWRSWGVGYGP